MVVLAWQLRNKTPEILIGGGWFITPSLLLKGEYVSQTYNDFIRSDIRSGLKFNGFMIEAITAF